MTEIRPTTTLHLPKPGRLAVYFCALSMLVSGLAGAATWTVGEDPETCNFRFLDAAIAAADDGDTLRLSVGTYSEEQDGVNSGDLAIWEKSLTVIGGHSHCGGPVVGTSRLISEPRAHAVLVVHAFDAYRHVRLENLVIALGNYDRVDHLHFYGGGLTVEGSVVLEAENLSIEGNHALRGGGLDVTNLSYGGVDRRPHVTLEGSRIAGNTARFDGGGMRCRRASVTFRQVDVRSNTAGGHGGGLHLDECFLTIEHQAGLAMSTMRQNLAGAGGGGLQLAGESVVLFEHGKASSVVFEVAENVSLGDGGGALVDDSLLLASAIRFRDNVAVGAGGAIAAVAGSYVSIGETMDACGKAAGCNFFSGNRAGEGGGAIDLRASTASLLATRGVANTSQSGAFARAGDGSTLRLWSVALDAHAGDDVVRAIDAKQLDVRSSTFYDNLPEHTVVRVKKTPASISQSIFHQNGVPYLAGDAAFTCNFIDGLFADPSTGAPSGVGDPIFVAAGDFHLDPFSPAAGSCNADTPHAAVDLNYRPRPSGDGFEPGADEL